MRVGIAVGTSAWPLRGFQISTIVPMALHPTLAASQLLVHLEFSQPTIYSWQKKSHSSLRFYHTGSEVDVRKEAETVISHCSSIVLSTWPWSFTQQLNLELSIGNKERCIPSFRKDRRREGKRVDAWKEWRKEGVENDKEWDLKARFGKNKKERERRGGGRGKSGRKRRIRMWKNEV